MFGSNSPSYPERARDPRVRLAHPDSQIQLSNSDVKKASQLATAFNHTCIRPRRQAGSDNFLEPDPRHLRRTEKHLKALSSAQRRLQKTVSDSRAESSKLTVKNSCFNPRPDQPPRSKQPTSTVPRRPRSPLN